MLENPSPRDKDDGEAQRAANYFAALASRCPHEDRDANNDGGNRGKGKQSHRALLVKVRQFAALH